MKNESICNEQIIIKALHYNNQTQTDLLQQKLYSEVSQKQKLILNYNKMQNHSIHQSTQIQSNLSEENSQNNSCIKGSRFPKLREPKIDEFYKVSRSLNLKNINDSIENSINQSFTQQSQCDYIGFPSSQIMNIEKQYLSNNQDISNSKNKKKLFLFFKALNQGSFQQSSQIIDIESITSKKTNTIQVLSSLHEQQQQESSSRNVSLSLGSKKSTQAKLTPFIIKMKEAVKQKFPPFLHNKDIQSQWPQCKKDIYLFCLENMNLIQQSIKQKSIENYLKFSIPLLQATLDNFLEKSFVQFINLIGQFCFACKDYNKAAFFFNESYIICDNTKKYSEKCNSLIGLAKVAYICKMDELILILKKALQYAVLKQDINQELEIFEMIGQYYFQQGDVYNSLYFHKKYTHEQYETKDSLFYKMSLASIEYYEKSKYFSDKITKSIMLKLSLPIYNKLMDMKSETEYYRCDELRSSNYQKCSYKYIVKQLVKNSEFTSYFVDYITNFRKEQLQEPKPCPQVWMQVKLICPQKKPQIKITKFLTQEQKLKNRIEEQQYELTEIFEKVQNKINTEDVDKDKEQNQAIYIRQHVNPVVVNNAHNYFVVRQQNLLKSILTNLS